MADNHKQQDQRIGAAAEVARRGAAEARTTAQAADDALREGAQAGAGTAEQASRSAGDALHRTGRVSAEVVRGAGEAARQGTEAATEAARRGAQAGAEILRRAGNAARQGTEAAAESGHPLARSMQGGTEELWRLMAVPATASRGLQDMQQVFARLAEDAIRTNLQVTQELFRLANPGAVVELQWRFARQCLDALVAGQATVFRGAGLPPDRAVIGTRSFGRAVTAPEVRPAYEAGGPTGMLRS
jgi:hypothetical protein